MASSLATQLASYRANAVASLDLRLQKSLHSRSLVWQPQEAASQTLQKLSTICFQAFKELCLLDPRLASFSQSLFSTESERLDRTTLTAAQNEELDRNIEGFLRLAGKHLNLQIAVRSVEWLIRRFRILDMNTRFLITTFLPWHTLPIFNNLLEILPANLPPMYIFLRSYAKAKAPVVRDVFVKQATRNRDFLTTITKYTIDACKAGQGYHGLVTFWGGITAQALVARIRAGASGRQGRQTDSDQTLLQLYVPIIRDAVSVQDNPSLQIATYTIIVLYAVNGNLEYDVVGALMEQLVHSWDLKTVETGIQCLAVLAQQRSPKPLPRKVTKALLKVSQLRQVLAGLGRTMKIDRLVLGFGLGLIHRFSKTADLAELMAMEDLFKAGNLRPEQSTALSKSLAEAAHDAENRMDLSDDTREALRKMLAGLTTSESDHDHEPAINGQLEKPAKSSNSTVKHKARLDSLTALLESKPKPQGSCLASSLPDSFYEWQEWFGLVSAENNSKLLDRGLVLLGATSPGHGDLFYETFLIRLWSGPYPPNVRQVALQQMTASIKLRDSSSINFHFLIPYGIVALCDPLRKVRNAAAEMMVTLNTKYRENKAAANLVASETIYGQSVTALDQSTCDGLLTLISRAREECIMSPDYMSTLLHTALRKSHDSNVKHLSKSTKPKAFCYLAAHAIQTPLLRVKIRILKPLNLISSVHKTSRTHILIQIFHWWSALSGRNATAAAKAEDIDETRMDEAAAAIIVPGDRAGLETASSFLGSNSCAERPGFVTAIFTHLTTIWPDMKDELRLFTAEAMMDLCAGNSSPATDFVNGLARILLEKVELDSAILESFLKRAIASATLPSHELEKGGFSDSVVCDVQSRISTLTLVLDLVAKSNPAEHPELIDPLFSTLSQLRQYTVMIGSELGYLQNSVLRSLLAMIPAYKQNTNLVADGSHRYGDLLVDCVRHSSGPSVQNSALLVVGALASVAPELILHSIMPIFAFMGTSVFRQGDDYSAQVVNQTIKSVVPALMKSFHQQKRNTVFGTAELLLHFVTAYEHVPGHRRIGLYRTLLYTLGPSEYLFALAGMLVDKFGATEDVLSFVTELASSYPIDCQIKTVRGLVELVADIFSQSSGLSAALFGLNIERKSKPFEVAGGQLSLLPRILSNKRLRIRASASLETAQDTGTGTLLPTYSEILHGVLSLFDIVKADDVLQAKCGDTLANLLQLLSISTFVEAIRPLLDRSDVVLRQRVLRSLEFRINNERKLDSNSGTALLHFLPTLCTVISTNSDIACKRTAVSCIDKITESYGKKNIELVTEVANVVAGENCLGHTDSRLRNMALLCLTSFVGVLQDAIVEVVPVAVPTAATYIMESIGDELPNSSLHNSGFKFFTSLSRHLPYLMSGSYLDQLLVVWVASSSRKNLTDDCVETRRECVDLLARRVEAKAFFVSMQKTWNSVSSAPRNAIMEYLEILCVGVDNHGKSVISKCLPQLSAIFMNALDLRSSFHYKGSSSALTVAQLDELESMVNKAAIKMILKLNDATFRPLFTELIDWATSTTSADVELDAVSRAARLQSIYSFLAMFFATIKSAATNYVAYVVQNAVFFLGATTPEVLKDPMQLGVWRRILVALTKAFEHDTSDFWQAPAYFNTIAPVLTAQLAEAPQAGVDAQLELIPAIVELAAAADSQDHYKELNKAILKHVRSEAPKVRLAAVLCQQALVKRHGEDWLQSLPEMLPYISEMQNDDDDDVEREAHRWINMIEAVLGEDLKPMLA